jgi:DNA replication and repair protein RecF
MKDNLEQKVVCINRGGNRKELYLNDVPYEKFSKHIGLLPAVMIAPDDIELITGKSEFRRKYIDTVLSQLDPGYLQQLIIYTKVLQQRNSLLKKMDDDKVGSMVVLEILDEQLLVPGIDIHIKRAAFLKELIPLVQQFYHMIADQAETIALEYSSQLNEESFAELLKLYRQKDMLLQRNDAGIHKDDILFELNGQPFKNIASQETAEKACCLHLSWPNLNY